MKVRLAQHTVDCSGDAVEAQVLWRAQGSAWLPLAAEGWKDRPMPVTEGTGQPWIWTRAFWGASLNLLHLVEPGLHGTRLHARAELEGPLAWFHSLRLRAAFRARLPEALRRVARGVATVRSSGTGEPG